jgi:hypothetical protein
MTHDLDPLVLVEVRDRLGQGLDVQGLQILRP